jgi:hypothetical protein
MNDAELRAALLGFSREASAYCRGLSDSGAQDYALAYVAMIEIRARGMESDLPKVPHGLFGPNRNLIRSVLEGMRKKYALAG